MKSDLFSNLCANANIYPLRTIEVDGITWIRPEDDSKPVRCCLFSVLDNLMVDFLKLGQLLKESINVDDYQPNCLSDRIIVGGDNEKHIAYIDTTAFSDDVCPFFVKDKQLIIRSIMTFVNKYGAINLRCEDGLDASTIEDYVVKKFGRRLYFTTEPVSWVGYKFFELFLIYRYPQKYIYL